MHVPNSSYWVIISGKHKSRLINIPDKPNLKPTKTFIRESLFNTIDIEKCESSLDLFSGSGILSIEALSRGVQNVVLVEQDIELISSIKSNLLSLGENAVTVINKKVHRFLKDNKKYSFDIIFVDPPYGSNHLEETLRFLRDNEYLEKNIYLYFENSKKDKNDYKSYIQSTHNIVKDLSIGDVSYTISVNKNI